LDMWMKMEEKINVMDKKNTIKNKQGFAEA
jgi:hypothetical protein